MDEKKINPKLLELCNLAVVGSCIENRLGKCPFPGEDEKCGLCFAHQIAQLFPQVPRGDDQGLLKEEELASAWLKAEQEKGFLRSTTLEQVLADGELYTESDILHGKAVAKARRDLNKQKLDEAVKAEREKLLKDKLSIHIADKENLVDVGEWAECQDVGVFVYFPYDSYWQALKGESND